MAEPDAPPPAPPPSGPRLPDGRLVAWQPNPGPQTRFLALDCNEILFGGASGGGKTAATVAAPLRWTDNPHFRALILRRETTDLGKLLTEARLMYRAAEPEAKANETSHTWNFPSGAQIRFSHCQREADAFGYQGDEFAFVAFDELTLFTRSMYLEICSRIRSAHTGLPRAARATSNPGGPGHEWVFERWGAWLNPEFEAEGLGRRFGDGGVRLPPAPPGRRLWTIIDAKDEKERYVPRGTPGAQSRTFIPATLADNPQLLANDPDYLQRIRAMGPVRRRQLELGDWLVKPARGMYFKRGWFKFVAAPPASVRGRVRYWDLAGSPEGDWAVGAKLSRTPEGVITVEHIERRRGTPGEVRAMVRATAELDGGGVEVWIEQDPGQAGKDQVESYAQMLSGWTVRPRPKRVDKVTAAGPLSSQAQAGNVVLVRGAWNEAFVEECESFPDGEHDDQVDAASGAFTVLHGPEEGVMETGRLDLMRR